MPLIQVRGRLGQEDCCGARPGLQSPIFCFRVYVDGNMPNGPHYCFLDTAISSLFSLVGKLMLLNSRLLACVFLFI